MLHLDEYGQFLRDMRPVMPVAIIRKYQDPISRETHTIRLTVPGEPIPGTDHLAIIPDWMQGVRRDPIGHRYGVSLSDTWVERWTITHIPSGLRVPPPIINFLATARRFGRDLVATGYDWSPPHPRPDQLHDDHSADVMTVIKDLMRELVVLDDRARDDSARLYRELRKIGVKHRRHSGLRCAS